MKRRFVAASIILLVLNAPESGVAEGSEMTAEERVSMLKGHKVLSRYGYLDYVSAGKNTELPPDLAYPKGQLSLVADPLSARAGRIAVFVINDTQSVVPSIVHELNTPWQEVRDGQKWKRTGPVTLGCGSVPPPSGLEAGCFIIDSAPDPGKGDVEGELRYCMSVPNGRPLFSSALIGRYSSQLFAEAGHAITALENEIEREFDSGVLRGHWAGSTIAENREEFAAALELMRSYSEMRLLRESLQKWIEETHGNEKNLVSSGSDFTDTLARTLAGDWRNSLSEHGMFVRCVHALSTTDGTRYGTPEKCRRVVWRCLEHMTWPCHFGGINPERFDQLEFYQSFGNPWGADRKEMAGLLAKAEVDVISGSPDVRDAAGWFLSGHWIPSEVFPDEHYRNLLKAEAPEALRTGVLGLAARKHRNEAISWVGEHFVSLRGQLSRVWSVLSGDKDPFAEWERPVVGYLLEKNPLRTFDILNSRFPFWVAKPDGGLPSEFHKPIRDYLLKEAQSKRVVGPKLLGCDNEGFLILDESAGFDAQDLGDGLAILAGWRNKDDTGILRMYLQHPGAGYVREGKNLAKKYYPARKTAADLLKAVGEPVPSDIVLEEIIQVGAPPVKQR